jgi:hypothetical protein
MYMYSKSERACLPGSKNWKREQERRKLEGGPEWKVETV